MFIKAQKKPLKYTMEVSIKGQIWALGLSFSSFKKAHEYAMETSNGGYDCLMTCTRGAQFEYEKRYYGLSASQIAFNNLPVV